MLKSLFARLTERPENPAERLFTSAVAEARRPAWYVEAKVPDTVEGRFCVLSTVLALIMVKLDSSGPAGEAASVALTEQFIATMDVEVREMGVGDPALGKQVRSLVGALANRVGLWRAAVAKQDRWGQAVARSLYRGTPPEPEAFDRAAGDLRLLWSALDAASLDDLVAGKW